MFPHINLLLVIQHVEPYKYTCIFQIILISLFHIISARFISMSITLHCLTLSMLEHKTCRATGTPDISLEGMVRCSKQIQELIS